MTPFRGQTENAGHFMQPTARAIGHSVISLLLLTVCAAGRSPLALSLPVLGAGRTELTGGGSSAGIGSLDGTIRNQGCSHEFLGRLWGNVASGRPEKVGPDRPPKPKIICRPRHCGLRADTLRAMLAKRSSGSKRLLDPLFPSHRDQLASAARSS